MLLGKWDSIAEFCGIGKKELLMMSTKVQKFNKIKWAQERNFLITNFHIYIFNKKSK